MSPPTFSLPSQFRNDKIQLSGELGRSCHSKQEAIFKTHKLIPPSVKNAKTKTPQMLFSATLQAIRQGAHFSRTFTLRIEHVYKWLHKVEVGAQSGVGTAHSPPFIILEFLSRVLFPSIFCLKPFNFFYQF